MKKKILTGALICAAVAGIAGCGGSGSGSEDTTTATSESATVTTTEKETKETKENTTSATTTEETTKETETTSTTAEPSTTSAEPAPAGEYKLVVNKVLDGFEKIGDMEYDGPDAMYTYSVLNDATKHEIESRLDADAASINEGTTRVKGDVMYSKGKTDHGYSVTAYRYMAPGNSVSAYAGVQYLSENETSVDSVIELLSDDYISFTR